jgi:hypothetical protein
MTTKNNTSLVKNTARPIALKGNAPRSKSRTRRRTRRNTTETALTETALTANRAKRSVRSRRRYRRNASPGAATAGLIAAFGGALVINSFDALINRVAPNTSGMLRTVGKFGAGFLVGMYGNKLPVIGRFAPVIRNSLYLAGALDVVGTYVMPKIFELIDSAKSQLLPGATTPAQTVIDPATGQLGYQYQVGNGDVVQAFPQRGRAGYLNPQPRRSIAYA